jgi:transaldolase
MLREIADAAQMGVIDGVTTNPSLVAKTGRSMSQVIGDIVKLVDGPISAEVLATDTDGILKEGRLLAKIHPNIVVKVPLIADGLKAVRVFTEEGIRTNVTLCFSLSQGLLAAKAGATYISPFVGRLDDISHDGMELVEQLVDCYQTYDLATQVLAASIRHPLHVVQAATLGAHVATIPHKVICSCSNIVDRRRSVDVFSGCEKRSHGEGQLMLRVLATVCSVWPLPLR